MWLTGDEIAPKTWGTNEPNDASDGEDGEEQIATLSAAKRGLTDVRGNEPLEALCECDGRKIAAPAHAIAQTLRDGE